MTRPRPAGRPDESGFSLTETLVAVALTAVALLIAVPVLAADNTSAAVTEGQNAASGAVGNTLAPLDAEIRSAAVVYTPSPPAGDTDWSAQGTTAAAGQALVVLSEYRGTLACYQWADVAPGVLETRSWAPGATEATPFDTVAATPWPPPATPFSVSPATPPVVTADLSVRHAPGQPTVAVTAEIAAVNPASAGWTADCEQAPPT